MVAPGIVPSAWASGRLRSQTAPMQSSASWLVEVRMQQALALTMAMAHRAVAALTVTAQSPTPPQEPTLGDGPSPRR
eukprot:COSAG01_NODE_5339_length_4325_cov_2.893043_1_plen_77_part_00